MLSEIDESLWPSKPERLTYLKLIGREGWVHDKPAGKDRCDDDEEEHCGCDDEWHEDEDCEEDEEEEDEHDDDEEEGEEKEL